MSCNFPIDVYQDRDGGPVSFYADAALDHLEIPCGRCAGCRLGRAQAWSIRCQHEASLHDENCFVTLTYDDGHLPSVGGAGGVSPAVASSVSSSTLFYPHVQAFNRSLRKRVAPKRFSFLCAGEYGERTSRPHYHMLLFGHRFDRLWDLSRRGEVGQLGESDEVKELWPFGNHFVGELTPQSASYVSQYCLKKVYGQGGDSFYDVVEPFSGEVLGRRVPEFLRMSLRPAIGRRWFEKFGSDVLPRDVALSENVRYHVPRYYEKLFATESPLEMDEVEFHRHILSKERAMNRAIERRSAREEILRARVARNAERRKV